MRSDAALSRTSNEKRAKNKGKIPAFHLDTKHLSMAAGARKIFRGQTRGTENLPKAIFRRMQFYTGCAIPLPDICPQITKTGA